MAKELIEKERQLQRLASDVKYEKDKRALLAFVLRLLRNSYYYEQNLITIEFDGSYILVRPCKDNDHTHISLRLYSEIERKVSESDLERKYISAFVMTDRGNNNLPMIVIS